ncbi:hypothetical protein ABZS83_09125 [Streptomyces sp. NPDC005426]|uniref:hypothetical protein n=1 Tax=Streptomyces sp. NPDC005426 TaxID=3155344 RepID=UPI0033BB58B2
MQSTDNFFEVERRESVVDDAGDRAGSSGRVPLSLLPEQFLDGAAPLLPAFGMK